MKKILLTLVIILGIITTNAQIVIKTNVIRIGEYTETIDDLIMDTIYAKQTQFILVEESSTITTVSSDGASVYNVINTTSNYSSDGAKYFEMEIIHKNGSRYLCLLSFDDHLIGFINEKTRSVISFNIYNVQNN